MYKHVRMCMHLQMSEYFPVLNFFDICSLGWQQYERNIAWE